MEEQFTLMKRIETVEINNDINASSSTQDSELMTTSTDTAVDERSKLLGVYWDSCTDNAFKSLGNLP